MMRQMRENTKWIMLVTALAFVALMVFEWGMDITGRSAGGLGQIGSVNGDPVMYDTYQTTYRQLYDQVQASQEDPLTSQQVKDLEDQAFDQVVNQLLIEQELERRGIRVTDDEILQAARFNPPPDVQQLFVGEDGFDMAQYQSYLASPGAREDILQYIEAYFRAQIPRGKLFRQVAASVYLTDEELWRQWRDQRETVEVRYVSLDPARRISDDQVTVTEDEVESYYEDHQEEFEVPARADVKAVILRKAPTAQDTADQAERARSIAEELRGGASWSEVAAIESSDQATASEGGELGVFRKDQMTPPFDSAVFEGPVGGVQDPVRTSFGWHVIEVQERWGQDSARARHVLVEIERTDDSEIALLTMADSLEDLGENRSLEEAARLLGVETVSAQLTDELAFIPGGGEVGEGADWAFGEASPGDVSPVFENSQAFYALELVQTSPRGVMSLEEARPTIRQILLQEKKMAVAVEEAAALVERVRAGASFPDAAEEAGLEPATAGPFTRNDFVPGIGRRNAAVGAAFGLEVGELSDPVSTNDDVFVIEKVGHTPADSTAWEEQKGQQRQRLQSALQQQRLQEWLASLRENARIVDRRDEVLQPADEEAPLTPGGGFGF